MEAEAARCQAPQSSLERWVLREIRAQDQSGLAAENLNRRTPAGKMIRDVGGILRQGLRDPEQDKAPPRTGQRPDQEHKKVHGFEQHNVIVGKAVKRHLAGSLAGPCHCRMTLRRSHARAQAPVLPIRHHLLIASYGTHCTNLCEV